MEVHFAGSSASSDKDIASRAASLLKWNVLLPKDAIQVKVAKGWITLSGEVAWRYQRRAAEDNVRGLVGVRGVSNLVTVKPQVIASDIVRGIEEALKCDARLESQKIRVSVAGGTVKLEGHVHSWSERDAAERAAWAAPGVRAVEDRVSIG